MISEIAAWLFALFVVDPLHSEIRQKIDEANLPVQALQQSRQCISTHSQRLLERAGEEPGWALGTAIGVGVGWTSAERLLDMSDPNCATLGRVFKGDAAPEEDA
jgi:hypothetical protein